MKAVTIRIEDSLHKKLKLQMVNDETSFQEYMTMLILNDMKRRESNEK
ncbi:MAG: hypothetical protein ACRCWM_04245 [Sarcina sp.]